jgi:hypothetical protein
MSDRFALFWDSTMEMKMQNGRENAHAAQKTCFLDSALFAPPRG